MVVSPITETVVLSYLYPGSIISICFQIMLRRSTCHNLFMPRSFRQHACISIISNAATCHNFFMLRSFRQHACSCKVCSHRPENVVRRDAREKKYRQNQARGARRRPALSSCYAPSSKVKEEETSSPARHYTNIPLCRTGNLYKATQSRSSTNSISAIRTQNSLHPVQASLLSLYC
jgi:hypothetical protein